MNPFIAEFIGTLILIAFGNGVVANVVLKESKGHDSGWIVITWGWGLAVTFAVFTVGRISGAHINPAVTLGLASIGDFPWANVPGYIIAQILGGIAGAAIVWMTYLPHWKATEDKASKLACFATGPAIRNRPANFLTEVLGTAFLVFGVLAIGRAAVGFDGTMAEIAALDPAGTASIQEGLKAAFGSFIAPLLVGLLVLALGLSFGGPTGYAINPARDLGPRIAHAILPIAGKGHSDWGYAWVPVLAPVVGGIIGAQVFILLGL
jgi:glycerol uptake facilitator protein